MNDLYYNIIIIVLVLVLFLAYILIAYFYTSYSNYKEDVDVNFEKTKNYINLNITKLDSNIRTSIDENNTKIFNTSNYISDINTKVNRNDLKYTDNYSNVTNLINVTNTNLNTTNSNLNNTNSNFNLNINNTNSNLNNTNSNIYKFDTNIKQFFQYKSNGTTINDAIFNYQFGVSPNLSLDLLRNVNAISGMTVETDNSTNNFRLCDKSRNCMDMNIDNRGLNIFPSVFNSNNTTSNIYIYDKNKTSILAKFDLANRGIYLGGDGENAGMYINNSNVYVKKVNILNGNYANILPYDKTKKGQTQTYNTYSFGIEDINNQTEITGIYSIIRGTETPPQNIIILNFKSSNDIPSGTSLLFNLPEISNTLTSDFTIPLLSIETYPSALISSAILNVNNIKINTTSLINKNINVRIKLTSDKFIINSLFTEPTITNIINYLL